MLEVLTKKEKASGKSGIMSIEIPVTFKNKVFQRLVSDLDTYVNYTIDFTLSANHLTILLIPHKDLNMFRRKFRQLNAKVRNIIKLKPDSCECKNEDVCRFKGCGCRCHMESQFFTPEKWSMTPKEHILLGIATLGLHDPITKVHIKHFRNHMSIINKNEICSKTCTKCSACGLWGDNEIITSNIENLRISMPKMEINNLKQNRSKIVWED